MPQKQRAGKGKVQGQEDAAIACGSIPGIF
jgi:hypothetical protein